MTSIGDELRTERMRRGITLQQVAAETRIDLWYLEAMETNRFDDISLGTFFRRSFLRQYARFLELDDASLVNGLREQFETFGELPPPPPRRSLHIPPSILYCVLAASALVGVYQLNQKTSHTNASIMTAMREGPSALESSLHPRPAMAIDPPSAPGRQLPVIPASTMIHVELRAAEPVWLSITSDGISAYQGTLETEQKKSVDASAKLTVLAGNAQGLQIWMNGKAVDPVGSHGQVVLLEFTPTGLRVLHPAHKAPSDSPPPESSGKDTPL